MRIRLKLIGKIKGILPFDWTITSNTIDLKKIGNQAGIVGTAGITLVLTKFAMQLNGLAIKNKWINATTSCFIIND